jgi:hypothetical protein
MVDNVDFFFFFEKIRRTLQLTKCLCKSFNSIFRNAMHLKFIMHYPL